MKIPIILNQLRQQVADTDTKIRDLAREMPSLTTLFEIQSRARTIIAVYEFRKELQGKVQAIEIATTQLLIGTDSLTKEV